MGATTNGVRATVSSGTLGVGTTTALEPATSFCTLQTASSGDVTNAMDSMMATGTGGSIAVGTPTATVSARASGILRQLEYGGHG
ncbi:hypothetical protein PC128_g13329 [Phytophthora cactorum]|nr:hypothetical protein PC121_g8044 [Phytophthora cactorum]KAG3185366.1 hypothetical protein PC128_g13329 [Phytophthora cactorum]KAG4057769.1 hypothetical protein PC123_g7215 [Phytophthora cactorum]